MTRKRQIAIGQAMSMSGRALRSQQSLEGVAQVYLERQRARLSRETHERSEKIIRANLFPYFGPRKSLRRITLGDLKDYVSARSQQVSSASIAKEISVMRRIFDTAIDLRLCSSNPATAIKLPKKAPKREVKYMTLEQFTEILRQCPEWLKVLAEFALWTGLRRGELAALRWEDLDGQTIRIRMNKKGALNERQVPLTKRAQELLASIRPQRRNAIGPVFAQPPATEANISLQFLRAARRAGIERISFHEIRRTAILMMVSAGIDLNTVSRFFGHSHPEFAARYLQENETEFGPAVKVFNQASQKTTFRTS